MTTSTITPEIVEFARGVRIALDDLPADEVEDLTDGLEADLAESYAEDLRRELPDPIAYAEELRNAAGLPRREVSTRSGIGQSLGGVIDSIRLRREGLASNIRQSSVGAGVLDLMVELRPVWWILRAWVAFQLVGIFFGFVGPTFPSDLAQWALLGIFALISVQWGRDRWLPARGVSGLILFGNVIAAIALLPTAQHAYDASQSPIRTEYVDQGFNEPLQGVMLNGKPVTNIFGYGPDGKQLLNVQLFDQDGHPLATSVPGGNGCLENTPCVEGGGDQGQGVWVPSILETGAKAWNVFPMQMQGAMIDEPSGSMVPDPAQKPQTRTSPFIKVPALLPATKTGSKVVQGNE